MKVAFDTLGCRVNQYETEAMAEIFLKDGWDVVDFNSLADVYVINTCSVTSMADKKSRQAIHRAKRENSSSLVAVVGCYSQIAPEKIKKIDGVDIVLGTRNKGDILKAVKDALENKEKVVTVNEVLKSHEFEDLEIDEYLKRTRGFIKIQDGCNNFCSYCLIPYARGGICSKKKDKVFDEALRLSKKGIKEVILSGIHTASYGTDFNDPHALCELIESIEKIDGIKRIRLGSMDPDFFSEENTLRISKVDKMCPHFHLSLQSGSDSVLKRMNRHYTSDDYRKAVERLRNNIKDVSITTDIIVGFPGETEDEFCETYNFAKEIGFTKIHVFKYSRREGTAAAKMKDQVDDRIKNERSKKLISLSSELERNFIEKFIGKDMKVLFERKVDSDKNIYEGYTPNYLKVYAESCDDIEDKIVSCRLSENKGDSIGGYINIQ